MFWPTPKEVVDLTEITLESTQSSNRHQGYVLACSVELVHNIEIRLITKTVDTQQTIN